MTAIDDLAPYYRNRARNQLAWSIPQASMSPSGSSYDQGGFSPDAPPEDAAWYGQTPLDPAAFRPDSTSSSGPSGLGFSAQPQAEKSRGDISAAAGKVINQAKMAPPGMSDNTITTAAPGQPVHMRMPPSGTAPAKPEANSQIAQIEQRMADRAANPPLPIGSRPQDIDPATGKEKFGAKAASWGQRLALAVLAATKLAPYAQQIVRPEYSQQVAQQSAAEKMDEAQLKGLESGANIEALSEQRAATAEQKRALADPHYGRIQIDPAYAKENLPWLQPEIGPDGKPQYWIDKGAETTLSKPTPEEKLHVVGNALVDSKGNVIYSADKNPQSKFALWLKEHPNGTAEDFQAFESEATKQDDKERFVQQFLKDNKMSDTAANRVKALASYAEANQAPQRAPQVAPVTLLVPNAQGGYTVGSYGSGQQVPAGAVTSSGMSSQNVPTAATRGMAEKAPRVINFVDRINQLIDENEKQIGPLAGRWNEFTTGRVGLPNKGFAQLRTDAGLLETALMNMHVGARGGEQIMQHFHDLIGFAMQDPVNLRAALGEIRQYAEQVAAEGKSGNPAAQSGPGGITLDQINAEVARRKAAAGKK